MAETEEGMNEQSLKGPILSLLQRYVDEEGAEDFAGILKGYYVHIEFQKPQVRFHPADEP